MVQQPDRGQGEVGDRDGCDARHLTCDCHAHVFGPRSRYAMVADRAYTPNEAPAAAYARLLDDLGIGRAVLVQPSIYGFDNSCQLDALLELGIEARAVVALEPSASSALIEELHQRGARGVRANLLVGRGAGWDGLVAVADRIAPFGWHLDVQLDLAQLSSLRDNIGRLPVPLVLDHLADWRPGTSEEDTMALLGVLEHNDVWLKLSSIYRLSAAGPPYDDMAEVAARAVAIAPDRVIWGSDWPHPLYDGPPVDVELVLARVMDWCGGPAASERVLADNPARLFGFEPLSGARAEHSGTSAAPLIENATNKLEETQ